MGYYLCFEIHLEYFHNYWSSRAVTFVGIRTDVNFLTRSLGQAWEMRTVAVDALLLGLVIADSHPELRTSANPARSAAHSVENCQN